MVDFNILGKTNIHSMKNLSSYCSIFNNYGVYFFTFYVISMYYKTVKNVKGNQLLSISADNIMIVNETCPYMYFHCQNKLLTVHTRSIRERPSELGGRGGLPPTCTRNKIFLKCTYIKFNYRGVFPSLLF